MSKQFGLSFAQGVTLPESERAALLGGKGAGLARMTALGLPVPAGFTLTTKACQSYLKDGWTADKENALVDCLKELETASGKRLGDPSSPLLVSVRSGAPIPMPGMMDTVLNAGMTNDTAQALGQATGDARFG
ncbi:PEP/pyruvate-binding domain-containing protein [Roseobacter weihaiensis]|uniref:PEP/pyruvate-binding domain-containing protein n=1 Tax=Roseobacter weihaiensis TaxID=2763262 RepID=UPI001D09F8D3|nr:PEP/pyruvate-binding domain-containing protein [Roseobacter sp. H9]